MSPVSQTCANHGRFTPGCDECLWASRDYYRRWRALNGVTPAGNSSTFRCEADDEYAAGLMELLLQREIDVSRLSDFCSERLAEHLRKGAT